MKLRPRTEIEKRDYLIEYLADILFCLALVPFTIYVVDGPDWSGFAVAWLSFQVVRTRAVLTDRIARKQ